MSIEYYQDRIESLKKQIERIKENWANETSNHNRRVEAYRGTHTTSKPDKRALEQEKRFWDRRKEDHAKELAQVKKYLESAKAELAAAKEKEKVRKALEKALAARKK